jgi:hypothetical protein
MQISRFGMADQSKLLDYAFARKRLVDDSSNGFRPGRRGLLRSQACLADLIIGERKLRSDSHIHKQEETEYEQYKLTLDKTWYLANRTACPIHVR